MDVQSYKIKDEQFRFLIMKNFYEEVMGKLLERFLLVLHFRATGEKLGENCDILSKILPHLAKKHKLKTEDKYRENLFIESKRDLTPKPNLDMSKFDFTMSFGCLTEIQGLPSSKNHQFCVLCTREKCENILLGNAEKKECNNCEFCTTPPNAPCYSQMLAKKLNIGRKTRNIGAHTSQFSAEIPNIEENITAITALYEYLYTNENWRKFEKNWINHKAFFEIRENIRLIEKCSISFLLEKFKERIIISEEFFAIKATLDKMMNELRKKTLEISIQLSISTSAVEKILGLESFLQEAELSALNSRMRTTIEEVVNKSLANLIDDFKFDVHVWELEKVPGNGRFEKFKAGITFSSPNPNAFELYRCDKNPQSKHLQDKLTKSLFEELEKEVPDISNDSLTKLTLGFTKWYIASLHIMLALTKNDRSSLTKKEIEILDICLKNMTVSKQSFFKEIFGESVEVSIDRSPSRTNIATFIGQIEVNILSENVYYHSNDFANKLKRSVKMLLAQELKLEECSEINKNLATMLYSAEQSVSLHSQTSSNLVNIAQIGSVHTFIVETLPWFVLTIDVDQGLKSKLQTDWRILWGPLLTEVKINLRSLFHNPASGNFPKDGRKLYEVILELDQNRELNDLPKYWRELILPKNGISDSEVFDLYTLRCLLSKSKSMKTDAVDVIKELCIMMNGIKYCPIVDPYFMSVYIIDEIKYFLSSLGFLKESMKEVERLSALLEDVTPSEDELLEDIYRGRYFKSYVLTELLFKAEEYLRCLFHDPEYGDFPRDGRKLYETFIEWNKQGKLNDLEKKYFSTLLPDSKTTDSEAFDLHLLSYFLCKCTKIKDKERKIFGKIFDLKSQLIQCDSIALGFYQSKDILERILWKIKHLTDHYDVFNHKIGNDLEEFVANIFLEWRHLKKKHIVQSKMSYNKIERTDEKKTFEQTGILPK
ncbi:uncharacterized protein LOC130625536 [Hydractinia symbiolongicarpus]|uniref:uncharacterized protein LOC130625536 n=1 Tax=Hydractinia symbiolongicarpus TaxID=13093 RepID=UPI002550CEF3|nr:uncharacterized protein LOC130625536 [Hydractinia symbiolongicarpus]